MRDKNEAKNALELLGRLVIRRQGSDPSWQLFACDASLRFATIKTRRCLSLGQFLSRLNQGLV
ncbi:hypothetical protein [Pseudodesulfovibrio sp. zrk46]|uniref:hypothetical protein n=1 Tax=Pseudodesulfovibrio sp. zrk46 TaxID=2725288 RepID=UPI001449F2A2|nr:hypothetical protein [Pseudodesulfovibrio sp. zrk46]QJB55437.1 hypothetical protein HFN16_03090 [Pseudodesulfovibrio sp. zrk46]